MDLRRKGAMNYQRAIEILEMDGRSGGAELADLSTVKKHYRIMVLKYHPDKNREESSVDKFREIHAAYLYLKNTVFDNDAEYCEPDSLFSLLRQFIQSDKENRLHILYSFLQNQNIGGHIESHIVAILEKLDTGLLRNIRDILSAKPFENTVSPILNKITEIIENRNECKRVVLNPSLMDVFDCNLYKLTVKDQTFIIPLWHHEIVYDLTGGDNRSFERNELVVECRPILVEGIRIDENNVVHIQKTVKMGEIWGLSEYEFSLCGKKFAIDVRKLKFQENQRIVLYGQGIPRICKHAIYDCEKKSDIVVNLNIVL